MNQFTHFFKVLIGVDAPRSQVTARERALLCDHARAAHVIVEIGCFEGATANALGRATSGEVYTIDTFPRGRSGVAVSQWIAHLGSLRGRLRGGAPVTIIRGRSEDVARRFERPIDLLFIDADHSYKGVRRDWETWAPKVRPGGVIALHDCRQTPSHPHDHGSGTFYRQDLKTMSGFEEIEGVESVAVFRKKFVVPPLSRVVLKVNGGPAYQPDRAA